MDLALIDTHIVSLENELAELRIFRTLSLKFLGNAPSLKANQTVVTEAEAPAPINTTGIASPAVRKVGRPLGTKNKPKTFSLQEFKDSHAQPEIPIPIIPTPTSPQPERFTFRVEPLSCLAEFIKTTKDYDMFPGDIKGTRTEVISYLEFLVRKGMPDLFFEFMIYNEERTKPEKRNHGWLRSRLISFSQLWDQMVAMVCNRVFREMPLDPATLSADEFAEQLLGRWLRMQWELNVKLEAVRCIV